jgi:D-glycero-D-manno-heptose 1,7-bisphosphate phosphatase
MSGGRSAVFLDRDGTITAERGYVTRPVDLELIPGAAEAVGALNEAGFLVVLVSNQSGVARGLMDEEDLASVHEALVRLLAAGGANLDAAYYCPNHPDGKVRRYAQDASCRKPALGMLESAVRDLRIDVPSSFMVGDQITDMEFAARAGMPAVLVLTGKGKETESAARREGIAIAAALPDLRAAVDWILERAESRPKTEER